MKEKKKKEKKKGKEKEQRLPRRVPPTDRDDIFSRIRALLLFIHSLI